MEVQVALRGGKRGGTLVGLFALGGLLAYLHEKDRLEQLPAVSVPPDPRPSRPREKTRAGPRERVSWWTTAVDSAG